MRPTLETLYKSYFTDSKEVFILKYGEERYQDLVRFDKVFEKIEGLDISLCRQATLIGTTATVVTGHRQAYYKVRGH